MTTEVYDFEVGEGLWADPEGVSHWVTGTYRAPSDLRLWSICGRIPQAVETRMIQPGESPSCEECADDGAWAIERNRMCSRCGEKLATHNEYCAGCFHREVHRIVDWDLTGYEKWGTVSCRADVDKRDVTQMPSDVTCEVCLEVTPGLQVMGMLETVLEKVDLLPLNEYKKDNLRAFKSWLEEDVR